MSSGGEIRFAQHVWLSLNKGAPAVTCAFCRAGVTLAGQVDWTAVVRRGN